MQSTIPEMVGVTSATRADHQVLTIGLEDFEDDFNSVVHAIFRFIMHDTQSYLPLELYRRVATADSQTYQKDNPEFRTGHVADLNETASAKVAIQADPHLVWDQVRAFRTALGYAQPNHAACEDCWRRSWT